MVARTQRISGVSASQSAPRKALQTSNFSRRTRTSHTTQRPNTTHTPVPAALLLSDLLPPSSASSSTSLASAAYRPNCFLLAGPKTCRDLAEANLKNAPPYQRSGHVYRRGYSLASRLGEFVFGETSHALVVYRCPQGSSRAHHGSAGDMSEIESEGGLAATACHRGPGRGQDANRHLAAAAVCRASGRWIGADHVSASPLKRPFNPGATR